MSQQQQQRPDSPGSYASEGSWPEASNILPGVIPLGPSHQQQQLQAAYNQQQPVYAAVGRGPSCTIAPIDAPAAPLAPAQLPLPPLPAPVQAEPELPPKASRTKSAEHSHRCKTCDPPLYFTTSGTLSYHRSLKHSQHATVPVPGGQTYQISRGDDGRFVCPSCHKGFENAEHYRTHLLATVHCTLAHKWPFANGVPAGWTLLNDQPSPARSMSVGAVPATSPIAGAYPQSPVAMSTSSAVSVPSPPVMIGSPVLTTSPIRRASFTPQAAATVVSTHLDKPNFNLSEYERDLIERIRAEHPPQEPASPLSSSIRDIITGRRLPSTAPAEHATVRRLLAPVFLLPPPASDVLDQHTKEIEALVTNLARLLAPVPATTDSEGNASEPIMIHGSRPPSTEPAPQEDDGAMDDRAMDDRAMDDRAMDDGAMDGVEVEASARDEASMADDTQHEQADEDRTDASVAPGPTAHEDEEWGSPGDWL